MNSLLRLAGTRLFYGIITLVVVSIVIFFAVELLPGDVAQQILGRDATPETLAALRERLGLNDPAILRYLSWLRGIVQGDLGASLVTGQPIGDLVIGRLGNTLFLAAFAAIVAIPLALFLGVMAALYRDTWFDRTINTVTLAAISLPEFFIAYILVLFFSIGFSFQMSGPLAVIAAFVLLALLRGILQARKTGETSGIQLVIAAVFLLILLNGYFRFLPLTTEPMRVLPSLSRMSEDTDFGERIFNSILPMLTLVLVTTAYTMRMTRANIVNILAAPYIEMATLKGVPPARIIFWHALPNAWAPIINVVALTLAYLITGVVVVEAVFVYPGLGQLLVDSVAKRDITMVQACCLIFAAAYVLLNMMADVFAIATNPRLLHPK
ncbi:MAG: ABC transporter permease [Rhodobacteraceae bacterium]|nr:ABC transporter permease [Paracoccaceae bacterium]